MPLALAAPGHLSSARFPSQGLGQEAGGAQVCPLPPASTVMGAGPPLHNERPGSLGARPAERPCLSSVPALSFRFTSPHLPINSPLTKPRRGPESYPMSSRRHPEEAEITSLSRGRWTLAEAVVQRLWAQCQLGRVSFPPVPGLCIAVSHG